MIHASSESVVRLSTSGAQASLQGASASCFFWSQRRSTEASYAQARARSELLNHIWLLDPNKPFYSSSIPGLNTLSQQYNQLEASADGDIYENYNCSVASWVQYKLNQRNWRGGRSWNNAFAVLTDNVIFFMRTKK